MTLKEQFEAYVDHKPEHPAAAFDVQALCDRFTAWSLLLRLPTLTQVERDNAIDHAPPPVRPLLMAYDQLFTRFPDYAKELLMPNGLLGALLQIEVSYPKLIELARGLHRSIRAYNRSLDEQIASANKGLDETVAESKADETIPSGERLQISADSSGLEVLAESRKQDQKAVERSLKQSGREQRKQIESASAQLDMAQIQQQLLQAAKKRGLIPQ